MENVRFNQSQMLKNLSDVYSNGAMIALLTIAQATSNGSNISLTDWLHYLKS